LGHEMKIRDLREQHRRPRFRAAPGSGASPLRSPPRRRQGEREARPFNRNPLICTTIRHGGTAQAERKGQPMLTRAGMLSALALISLAGAAQALDQVTFGTNWKAQAEHGGFYQARGSRRWPTSKAIRS
jgi:hypothetical protein